MFDFFFDSILHFGSFIIIFAAGIWEVTKV